MKLAVCTETAWGKVPFSNTGKYDQETLRGAYAHLFETAKTLGITCYKTNFRWHDGVFTKGWVYEEEWKQVKNIKADFILDKSPLKEPFITWKKFFTKKKKICNPYACEVLCTDKEKMFTHFKQFMPLSITVTNKKEFLAALKTIPGIEVVIKPIVGTGGGGVQVVKKEKAIPSNYPFLVQQCVSSKKNFFPFPYGVFDLRVVVIDGTIIDTYYRISKPGVLTSNVATGARTQEATLPSSIKKIVHAIDEKIKSFTPRFYTADFVLDEQGKAWLIELNPRPGFNHLATLSEKKKRNYEKKLLTSLERYA